MIPESKAEAKASNRCNRRREGTGTRKSYKRCEKF
jgi:hypothetical protein